MSLGSSHTCACIFCSGPLPAVSKGTHVIVPLVEDLEDGRWEAAVVQQDDRRLMLSVNSPPTAVIGRYQLTVETSCPSGQASSRHDPADDIYMLFNPWCEGNLRQTGSADEATPQPPGLVHRFL